MDAEMFAVPKTRGDLPGAKLVLLPLDRGAPAQHVLTVRFRSPDGRCWNAIGGGDTLADAIEWARESCPHGTTWQALGWEDRYGD
jgi:hypothetical protein